MKILKHVYLDIHAYYIYTCVGIVMNCEILQLKIMFTFALAVSKILCRSSIDKSSIQNGFHSIVLETIQFQGYM